MQTQEIMKAYGESGLGVLILSGRGVVLSVNTQGDVLLHGDGQLVGQKLSDIAPELLSDEAEVALYTYIAYDEYLTRCPAPMVSDLPKDQQLIVFRKATKDAFFHIFSRIINQIEESIILCDRDSHIVMLNDAAEKMDSIVTEDVKGLPISDIYLMQDGSECAIPQAIAKNKPFVGNRQYYTTCFGRDVDIVANNYPIIHNGMTLGGFSVMQDWRTFDEMRKQIIDLQDKLMIRNTKVRPATSSLLSAKHHFRDIIHISPVMDTLINQCRQVSKTNSSVMICGETGTGKELIAQSIHNASPRAEEPFLAINCAAIPENLLESLLFGTEKGAFTGAEKKAGLFEQANNGSLLLDEINSMNINLQAKLLRVLQEKRIRRVGGLEEIAVDVRVLSNINIPPEQAMDEGKLRRDLFYRLGVVTVGIPKLSDRREDIPLLSNHFLMQYNEEIMRNVCGIDNETLALFTQYDWPGNVRELQHAIEHAINVLPDTQCTITPEYLPTHFLESATSTNKPPMTPSLDSPTKTSDTLEDALKKLELQKIREALSAANGNVSEAARILGMDRQKLQYRIKRYDINQP